MNVRIYRDYTLLFIFNFYTYMLVHIRQPFHSIATATVFLILAIFFGGAALSNAPVHFADLELGLRTMWTMTGLMFVMSYFSLVHLRHKD